MNAKHIFLTTGLLAVLALVGCANTGEQPSDAGKEKQTEVTEPRIESTNGSAQGGVANEVSVVDGNAWSLLMEQQRKDMEVVTQDTPVEVYRTEDNRLKISIASDAGFASGRYTIRPALGPVLEQLVNGLRGNPNARVNIVGHTDSTGTDAINKPLSLKRAASTRDFVVARGIAKDRITIEGRGSLEPVDSNDTREGRAMNRRVEIFVTEPAAK